MHFMSHAEEKDEPRLKEYRSNKAAIDESVERMMLEGAPFELIDGENLDFKGDLIQEVLAENTADKNIFVVAVIGPQSSGKSTLMNYAFGT